MYKEILRPENLRIAILINGKCYVFNKRKLWLTNLLDWTLGFLGSSDSKESTCSEVQSLIWKLPWRREWLPTPVFLPGEFHGHRSLAGCSPWGHKELDMTEGLTCLLIYVYGLGTTPKFINSSLTKIHI